MNECRAVGCRCKIAPDLVMCGRHWQKLPRATRLHIMRSGYDGRLATKVAKEVADKPRVYVWDHLYAST